ncbi:MAG: D-sedoheptulose 7-phosphate isomerase [Syntrophobacterales bacterium]|jgi:D-sedoheptulose 7-phosphate isomerase|nr:D-sedoheptulose 7-phosphate isomerase [Syntrophobacterales bacterium]
MSLNARFRQAFAESIELKRRVLEGHGTLVAEAARMLAGVFQAGGRVLIFGNGGSAADAQHLAAEFVNRFQVERPPLAALALTTDTSILTAVANDYDFQEVFAKQVRALGKPGDLAWGISTSGNSPNVAAALTTARELGLKTLALSGGDGGPVAAAAEAALVVPSRNTPRIQEVHITLGHVLCDLVDFLLFPEKFEG